MLGIASPERHRRRARELSDACASRASNVVTANSYTVLVPNGLASEQIEFWTRALDKVLVDGDFKLDLERNFWVLKPIRYPETVKWLQDDYDENRAILKELGMIAMSGHRTLFDKVWSDHVIVVSPQGEDLLYVDFNLINEGQSFLAFDQLRIEGRRARRPQQHLAVTDHYLPTINSDARSGRHVQS